MQCNIKLPRRAILAFKPSFVFCPIIDAYGHSSSSDRVGATNSTASNGAILSLSTAAQSTGGSLKYASFLRAKKDENWYVEYIQLIKNNQ